MWNEGDSSVSLHMWNGEDAMPFGCRKSYGSRKVVAPGVMPNLEVLEFSVPLQALKDNNGDCENIGLDYLPSLQLLRVSVNCKDVPLAESDAGCCVGCTEKRMQRPSQPPHAYCA